MIPVHSSAHPGLFPPTSPFDEGWLPVSGSHRIYHSQRGNPHGIPALVIHGGPGSGSSAQQARFFDPQLYRVVQFDQRGSGFSTPTGETRDNTTDLLVDDIDLLRRHLGIERWLVTGGSWGAALGAVYAAKHRTDITGLLLRGLFLAEAEDIRWFFQDVASEFPQAWSKFAGAAPRHRQQDLLSWLHETFSHDSSHDDEAAQLRAAQHWFDWEQTVGGSTPAPPPDAQTLRALCNRYRVQSHYLVNQCWLGDAAVVAACAALSAGDEESGIPIMFVQGELDKVCPARRARLAHNVCAGSTFELAAEAGHDPFHPAMIALMRNQLAWFADHAGSFPDNVR